MGMKTRFGALALAVALVATACGGNSTVEADQAAQLAELEAQLEELENRAAAPAETTTTAVPAETSTTTVTPETTAPVADTPATVISGERLNASMGPDQAAALLDSIIGPSDDVHAQARLFDFAWPELSTLPGTFVTGLNTQVGPANLTSGMDQRTVVSFTTTASVSDTALVYQTELAALFPDASVSSSASTNDDGRIRESARVGEYDVFASELESGETFVEITGQHSRSDNIPQEQIAAFDGLLPSSFVHNNPAATFAQVSLVHSFGSPRIEVDYDFVGIAEDDFVADVDTTLAAGGWVFAEERFGAEQFTVPSAPAAVGEYRLFESEDFDDVPTTKVTAVFDY